MRGCILALAFVAGCGPRTDLPEVVAPAPSGVARAPAQARAAYLRALWHEVRGEGAEARAALARARSFDPGNVELRQAQARLETATEARLSSDP